MASNLRDKVIFRNPLSLAERTDVASSCVRKLGIKIPAVIDDMDNSTEHAYTGWPDRIYLIDQNCHVVFKTKPGPFGFDPSQLEAPLRRIFLHAGPEASPPQLRSSSPRQTNHSSGQWG